MAGNEPGHRIGADGAADSARGLRVADPARQCAVTGALGWRSSSSARQTRS